jgi:hypothetical protein
MLADTVIDRDVNASVDGITDGRGEIVSIVIERDIGPELPGSTPSILGAGCRNDCRPHRGRELNGNVAHATAATVNQTRHRGFQASVINESHPRGHAHVGKPRTGRKRDALRKVCEAIRRRGDVLGAGPSPVGAPFGSKHAITDGELVDCIASRDNDASEIDPRDRG